MANQREKMLTAPIHKLILSLSLPTVIAMLVSALYNLADTYFVSSLGDSPAAAISVAFSVQALIQALGFTIGMGAGSLISRSLGAKDNDKANQHITQAVLVGLLLGTLFLIFGLIFRSGIVKLIGATSSAQPYAEEYLFWIFIASPFMMLSFIFNNGLRSEGKALLSMIGIASGGLLNLGLDPLFIYGLGMGMRGAGLATMLSQIFSFCVLGSFYLFKVSSLRINPKYLTRDFKSYLAAFSCGSPTLVRQGFSFTSNIIISFLSGQYGDAVVAALGITAKIYGVMRNIVIGIGQGYQPVIGYNYGAKQYRRIKIAFSFTLALQTGFCLLAMVLCLAIPGPLIRLFRDTPEVLEIGTMAIRFLSISLPLLGFSTIVNQSLQIMGYAKSACFLAGCRQGFVYTPVAFLFAFLWGSTGLTLIQPISDAITALLSIPFFIYMFRVILKEEVAA